jgi:hypothetical protein
MAFPPTSTHARGMGATTRVRVYKGIIEAEAEERFRVDAGYATRQGWYPIERRWDGAELRVVYAQQPDPRAAPRRQIHHLPFGSLTRHPH